MTASLSVESKRDNCESSWIAGADEGESKSRDGDDGDGAGRSDGDGGDTGVGDTAVGGAGGSRLETDSDFP